MPAEKKKKTKQIGEIVKRIVLELENHQNNYYKWIFYSQFHTLSDLLAPVLCIAPLYCVVCRISSNVTQMVVSLNLFGKLNPFHSFHLKLKNTKNIEDSYQN